MGDGPAVFDARTTTSDAYRLLVYDLDLPCAHVLGCLQTLRDRGVHSPAIRIAGTMDPDASFVQAVRATPLPEPLPMGQLGRAALRTIVSRERQDGGPSGLS